MPLAVNPLVTFNDPLTFTLSLPVAGVRFKSPIMLLRVLFVRYKLLNVAELVPIISVLRLVPVTSSGYAGLLFLIPTLWFAPSASLTKRYNKSFSKRKLTPSRVKLSFKSGPEIRPRAIRSPHTPCFTVNQILSLRSLLVYHSIIAQTTLIACAIVFIVFWK